MIFFTRLVSEWHSNQLALYLSFYEHIKNEDRMFSFCTNLIEMNPYSKEKYLASSLKWNEHAFAACDKHLEAINRSIYFISHVLGFKYVPDADSHK